VTILQPPAITSPLTPAPNKAGSTKAFEPDPDLVALQVRMQTLQERTKRMAAMVSETTQRPAY